MQAMQAMIPEMQRSQASQSTMSVLDLALSPKTLGETDKLCMEGSYKPARVGLQRALEAGHMRNPLQMRA